MLLPHKIYFLPQVERDDYKQMMAKYVGHIDVSVKSELGDKAESEMTGAKAAAPTVKKAGNSHSLSQLWVPGRGVNLLWTPHNLASLCALIPTAILLDPPEIRPSRR